MGGKGKKSGTPREARSAPLLPPPRRERETLIPHFDPEILAHELEAANERSTLAPPFDPSSYARLVDPGANQPDRHLSHRTITAVTSSGSDDGEIVDGTTSGSLGRAMYGSYLESDYPEALVLAERVLEREPDHALAQLVAEGCRARMGCPPQSTRLVPSSIVRLRRPAREVRELAELESDLTSQIVLGHLDGLTDVETIARLAGIPRPEALDRLHALLDLGVLEVLSGS
jgi:hypothetical protein